MSIVQNVIADLRAKRLWPIAAALALALVAVPVLLSTKAKSVPVPRTTPPFSPVSSNGVPIPTLTIQPPPTLSKLNQAPHDPFIQQVAAGTPTAVGSTGTSSSSVSGTSVTSGGAAASGTSSGASAPSGGAPGAGGSSTGSAPSGPTSTPPLAPVPPSSLSSPPRNTSNVLSDTQSYHVKLSITNASGGLDTIDPLERLSLLPSNSSPLLVDLGVLKGGNRVLFVVQPGTVVSGPGICTPGPIDCEVVSLAPDQVEQVSVASGSDVVPVALFAVTDIGKDDHPSAAAARQARDLASADGAKALSASPLDALSLFQYDPSAGAVVDLRDLTIGGS